MQDKIRIGTRGSPLALVQAGLVKDLLLQNGYKENNLEIKVFKTSGDKLLNKPLSEFGGKGLFTKELDIALLTGEIDIAVHSMKDVPTHLENPLCLGAYLPREDIRDVFISDKYASLDDLPAKAVIGTASLRRSAQLKAYRPDLQTILLRGNVQTRLQKMQNGDCDATLLAMAGLKRLNLQEKATQILPIEHFLPAPSQGAIGIACLEDSPLRSLLDTINHKETALCVQIERGFLKTLNGSCRMPIAGHTWIEGQTVHFKGQVLAEDGSQSWTSEKSCSLIEAETVGILCGQEILQKSGFKG